MKQRPGLRLFVVSDRNDKKVSYRSQLEFVERVKAHNLPITHVTATATDKDSHSLFHHGLRLAADCANLERAAERAWAVSKDTTTIAVLEEYVRRYGDSHYAALARARMEELRKSQAAAQTTVPPGFDAVPRPAGTIALPPGASPFTLPSRTANPLQLVPPASQPKIFSDRVGAPPAQQDGAQQATGQPAAPVAALAQRVVLYEEDPTDPQGKRYVGSAIWRTETVTSSPAPRRISRCVPISKFRSGASR